MASSYAYPEIAGTESLAGCLAVRGRGVRVEGVDVGKQYRQYSRHTRAVVLCGQAGKVSAGHIYRRTGGVHTQQQ